MANFGDYLADATGASLSTAIGGGVPTNFWSRKFLSLLTQQMVLHQFAQLQPLPEGNGKKITFSRPRPLATAMTALTEGQHPNATAILWQEVNATLKEYGDFGQITSFADQQHLNQKLLGSVEMFADQGAQTMNQLLLREICSQGCYAIPGDLATTSQFDGTFSTVTSTSIVNSTGLQANTNYGDANDDVLGSIITITSGPAEGESRTVSDFATSGGVITVDPAFDMLPEAGDSFHICTADEITTGDDLSWANVKKARAILKTRLAKPFSAGYYVLVVGPEEAAGLMDDTVWQSTQYYKDSASGTFTGEIGKFAGFRVVEHTTPFRFPITTRGSMTTAHGPGLAGANYGTDGTDTVSMALAFGKNSFASTSFKKKGKQGMTPPVIVKLASKYDTNNPLNRFGTVGWVIETVKKSLRGDHCVGIFVDAVQ